MFCYLSGFFIHVLLILAYGSKKRFWIFREKDTVPPYPKPVPQYNTTYIHTYIIYIHKIRTCIHTSKQSSFFDELTPGQSMGEGRMNHNVEKHLNTETFGVAGLNNPRRGWGQRGSRGGFRGSRGKDISLFCILASIITSLFHVCLFHFSSSSNS